MCLLGSSNERGPLVGVRSEFLPSFFVSTFHIRSRLKESHKCVYAAFDLTAEGHGLPIHLQQIHAGNHSWSFRNGVETQIHT